MPDLPHGWRMKNSTVDISGPPLEDDILNDGSDAGSDALDIKPDSEGWEDLEEDAEAIIVKCLICDETFPAVKAMLSHCSGVHNLDLFSIRRAHSLDFYATIKLVNYIRVSVKDGQTSPDVSNPALWTDDKFLQPVIEDDALLFGLDELDDQPLEVSSEAVPVQDETMAEK